MMGGGGRPVCNPIAYILSPTMDNWREPTTANPSLRIEGDVVVLGGSGWLASRLFQNDGMRDKGMVLVNARFHIVVKTIPLGTS